MDFLSVEQSVWRRLQEETRPIALYGMGDGADKILAQFDRLGIRASAVFASDEFARGNLFHGFCVRKLSDTVAELGEDIVIVIAFASQRPEVLQLMYALEDKYDVVAPDVPVVEGPLFDEDFVRAHQDEMQRAYDLLADDLSREVFLDTVRFKLSGKMEYLRHSESDKDECFIISCARPQRSTSPTSAHTTATPSASCCTTRTASLRPLPPSNPIAAASAS